MGDSESVSPPMDDMLDNISILLLRNGTSSGRTIGHNGEEQSLADFAGPYLRYILGCSIFPREIIRCAPARWRSANTKI